MKKLLSLVLAALLIVAALTPALAESPVEITVLFEGCNVTDDAAVLEQLNAYLAEKIGVTVKPFGAPGPISTIWPAMPSTPAVTSTT